MDTNSLDLRTIMRNLRESNHYQCLLDFQSYQHSHSWDEVIRGLLDERTIIPKTNAKSSSALVRLDIHIDVYSEVLQINHVVVMPFLVVLDAYENVGVSGGNFAVPMQALGSLIDKGKSFHST